MKMKRLELVEETFAAEKDPLGKKQLAYILGQQVSFQPHLSPKPISISPWGVHNGLCLEDDLSIRIVVV